MTTGNTVALTRRTFVDKVASLLFGCTFPCSEPQCVLCEGVFQHPVVHSGCWLGFTASHQCSLSFPPRRMRAADCQMHQWEDICSVFCSGNLSELDLSNSKLSMASVMILCLKLRNPQCRLQKLT